MSGYLGQRPHTRLTGLDRYADTLMKISDRIVRASESSKDRLSRSAKEPNRSSTHTVVTSDGTGWRIRRKSWQRREAVSITTDASQARLR